MKLDARFRPWPIDGSFAVISIIPLVEIDPELVEQLLDAAFGSDRLERTAYKVREGMDILEGLSVAAVDSAENELLGSLQCWPVALTDDAGKMHPMIMVGPVAVHPDCQGEGVGKAMLGAMLKELQEGESLPLVMIGDPAYYDRFFDFSPARTRGWSLPGPWEPDRLLVRAHETAKLPEKGKLGPWVRPVKH
ncbi:MAG: N-acetyltransferase [Pseudomonadota bacterium]